MSALLCLKNRFRISFRLNKFVISFHLIKLAFFPFCIQKRGSCNPTLLFIKTIGLEVCKRETLIMLVSKVTVAVGAWVFCSLTRHARLFIPPNHATSINMRKRFDAVTISKYGDRREDSETTLVFAHTPSLGF